MRTECPCGSPIAVETFDVEVSGLKVVQSWLRYKREKRRPEEVVRVGWEPPATMAHRVGI